MSLFLVCILILILEVILILILFFILKKYLNCTNSYTACGYVDKKRLAHIPTTFTDYYSHGMSILR